MAGLETHITMFTLQAELFDVRDSSAYEFAAELRKDAAKLIEQISEAFDPTVKSAHTAWKIALAQRDTYLTPVKSVDARLKAKMDAWLTKEKAKISEAQKELGSDTMVVLEAPKTDGVSSRKVWKYVVEDEALIPDEYWVIDEKKLGEQVRKEKDKCQIPGIRVFSQESTSVK